jgi:hypothetical protein
MVHGLLYHSCLVPCWFCHYRHIPGLCALSSPTFSLVFQHHILTPLVPWLTTYQGEQRFHFWGRCAIVRTRLKWDINHSHFSTLLFFYNWYRFFITAHKQQFELRCLEWKSPSYFNKPSYVLLSALFWSVKLNLNNNRAFYVSAVTEHLQLDVIKLLHLNVSELSNT